jgi:F0F1-type ATP synthase membrane subunit b/b'
MASISPDQTSPLTDEQWEQIQSEAYEEMNGKESEPKAQEEPKAEEKPEDKKEAPKAEVEPEEKPEESPEDVPPEQSKEPGETPPPENQPEKSPEELKAQEEEEVKQYALKHGMTEDDAKEDLSKSKALLSKYKSPLEMAKAHRILESEYHKLKAKADEPQDPMQKMAQNPVTEVKTWVEANREKLVEDYRKNFPEKSEMMSEGAILEELSERLLDRYQVWAKEQEIQTSQKAMSKRSELLESLSKEDREFIVDIKAVLNGTPDNQVVSDDFSMKDIVRWAKGGKYDDAIKKAREEGYKAGREEKRIIGEKSAPKEPNGSQAPAKSRTLPWAGTTRQKERALSMFDGLNVSDEEKFAMYNETYAEDLKSDPLFV